MKITADAHVNTHHCDVLVIGSGAGGFSAAITARKLGLDVLMTEKEAWFGGTTALSGGWLWIPCNPLAQKAGIIDSLDKAREYLLGEMGESQSTPNAKERIDAFLAAGPRMVDFFQRETEVRFLLGADYPDYHPQRSGALAGGRAICAEPFEGLQLGKNLSKLRPPVREMTLFGIKVGSGPDFRHFCNATRSLRSALYVAGRVLRHIFDVALHGRDLMMMSGNALVARLAKTAFDLGIPIWLDAPAVELINEDGRVVGARIKQKGQMVNVMARLGVVLAAGGFPHDLERRKKLYAHAPTPSEHYSLASPGNNGDGISMAESVGGYIAPGYSNAASWMPVSRVTYRDGSSGIYPHSFERGKPGVIAVNSAGTRFTNESDSYHDVVRAMIDAKTSRTKDSADQPIATFLVCDTRFIRRYGLGIAKPFPMPLSYWLRSGYLLSGDSIEILASKMDVDAVALHDTLNAFNSGAAIGNDPLYRRGENAYNRYLGDKDNTPNPCLAPISQAPFYAVKILPGDLGTFMGLATDRNARVMDLQGAPIDGLYAVGTDMASIFGGSYPGPGANLGPAMTFGFLCAEHIARKRNEK